MSKLASMSMKVSEIVITLPAGAVKVVAGHVQLLPYCATPAFACDISTPGAVRVPLSGPHAPPGTTTLVPKKNVTDAVNPSMVMLSSEVQATVSKFDVDVHVPSIEPESCAREGAYTDDPS
jgi:hypothetical protein